MTESRRITIIVLRIKKTEDRSSVVSYTVLVTLIRVGKRIIDRPENDRKRVEKSMKKRGITPLAVSR